MKNYHREIHNVQKVQKYILKFLVDFLMKNIGFSLLEQCAVQDKLVHSSLIWASRNDLIYLSFEVESKKNGS